MNNNELRHKNVFSKLKNNIEYFGDESNLHGVGYVFSMSFIPLFKRLFWFVILICCCFGASAILRGALTLYSSDLISYSVETNYLNWETPFPAVTVCEIMNNNRTRDFLIANNLSMGLSQFFKEVAFWGLKYCRTCVDCKMKPCMENFLEYIPKLRENCTNILTDCWWGSKKFPCCERFLPFETEYGTCYSFNSEHSKNVTIATVNRRVGIPELVFTAVQPFILRVHPPADEVSVLMDDSLAGKSASIPLTTDLDIILKAEQTTNDPSVNTLSRAIRGCLFRHERPTDAHLWPFHLYTYNACLMYCRVIKQTEICNCTHSFMPKLKDVPVCGVAGLGCLNINNDKLVGLQCQCPMACEDILYKVVHVFNHRHEKPSEELVKRGTRGRVQLAQLPTLRVRRHAIRDMLGLVVDIGGVGGVFFGASLLSVIEIVYLFCIRRGPN